MVRSGYVGLTGASDATSRAVSLDGNIWSRMAATWGSILYGSGTTSTAYYLSFNGAVAVGQLVYPSYGPHFRFLAFPLRCLSTAVEGEESDGCNLLQDIRILSCEGLIARQCFGNSHH